MENRMDRNWREGPHGGFGFILPLLAIPLAIGLMRGFAHHRFAAMDEGRRGAWKNGVPPMFAELHRRAHAAEAEKAAEAGEPAQTQA